MGTIVAAAATVAVARYDKVAEASVRFNTPSAYHAWSVGSHAVDDNNRIRQDVGDLTRTWTAQEPLKKHMLTCFAFAESSVFGYWNYMHKNDGADLTKKDWRKVIIRALCEANLQRAARVRAQPNFPSDECREGLRTVPEFSTWNEQTGQFERTLRTKLVRWRLCACVLLVAAWLVVTPRGAARHDVAAAGVRGGVGDAVACDVALVVVFVTMPPPPHHVPVFFAHGTASATLPRPPGRRLAVSNDCANVLPVLSHVPAVLGDVAPRPVR